MSRQNGARPGRRSGSAPSPATVGAALILALTWTLPVSGQDMKTLSVSRAPSGEQRLDVLVRFGAGELLLAPAARGVLYSMDLTWDDRMFEPVNEFDGRRLEVGMRKAEQDLDLEMDEAGTLDLRLGTDLPMDLRLDFGAGRAMIDLGGLNLQDLDLRTGASESELDVSRPNPGTLELAHLDIGAAEFRATRLGNLNAERIEVNAGVGDIELDFSGSLTQDLQVRINLGLGSLELGVPEEVGVRLDRSSFLTSFESEGFERREGVYYSSNWDSAERRIQIDIEAAFGSIRVVRTQGGYTP